MRNRERFVYLYVLVTASISLWNGIGNAPHTSWRIIYDIVIPITLVLAAVWLLIVSRRRSRTP